MENDVFSITTGSSDEAAEIIQKFVKRAYNYSDEISLYFKNLTIEQLDCLTDEDIRSISNIVGYIPIIRFMRELQNNMTDSSSILLSEFSKFSALRDALSCDNSNCTFNFNSICWLTSSAFDTQGQCKTFIHKTEISEEQGKWW